MNMCWEVLRRKLARQRGALTADDYHAALRTKENAQDAGSQRADGQIEEKQAETVKYPSEEK